MPCVKSGTSFWLGGATGGMGFATIQNFAVWTGNGPGLKNYTISRGAMLDYANANPGSISGMNGSGAYVQMQMVGETASGNLVFVNPVNGAARVKPADGPAYIQWVEFDNGEGGRNYGGDGSGSFMDNTMKVLDAINQWNPAANLMDLVSNGFTGRDRLGNKMSKGEAWLKAAGVVPIGRLTSTTNSMAHIFRNAAGHVNPTTLESQMRYMNLFSRVASNPGNLVTTPNAAAAAAGVQTFNQTFHAGTVWVQMYQVQIRNAGVNYITR